MWQTRSSDYRETNSFAPLQTERFLRLHRKQLTWLQRDRLRSFQTKPFLRSHRKEACGAHAMGKKPATEVMSKSSQTWWHESLNVVWNPGCHLKSQFLTPTRQTLKSIFKTDGEKCSEFPCDWKNVARKLQANHLRHGEMKPWMSFETPIVISSHNS